MSEFEQKVFGIVQERAIVGYPDVRPDVDRIVAAHQAALIEVLNDLADQLMYEGFDASGERRKFINKYAAAQGRS